jgi:hypothetical protein
MEIQLDILFIVVITYISSALFTGLIMNNRHRKKMNKLEKELLELNWYLLEQDNKKE